MATRILFVDDHALFRNTSREIVPVMMGLTNDYPPRLVTSMGKPGYFPQYIRHLHTTDVF